MAEEKREEYIEKERGRHERTLNEEQQNESCVLFNRSFPGNNLSLS